jgi:predicted  nucleic acid-binding Zn-ribbon protein
MLEQLSTIKAITFQLKRIQSDIEKINERSGDIERRMQKLENAVNRGSEQSISRSRRSSLS